MTYPCLFAVAICPVQLSTPCSDCSIPSNILEILSTHILIASVPEQASIASLCSLLARVVELALRFPTPRQCRGRLRVVGSLTFRTSGVCLRSKAGYRCRSTSEAQWPRLCLLVKRTWRRRLGGSDGSIGYRGMVWMIQSDKAKAGPNGS